MQRRWWWFVCGAAVFFAVAIAALQWWKFVHAGYNGMDLAIYSQVVWGLGHGYGFASSIHDPSYLGDHLELILVPLSWVYRLWSSPLMLLWVQTLAIGSAIIPLALIARRYLGSRGALVAVSLFCFHPLVYNISLYEFHALAFALPVVGWTIWFYLQSRYWPWLMMMGLLLLVREDMPLLVAGWSVLALIDRRRWQWWLPPLVAAAGFFAVAQEIIRIANHDGVYKYYAFYQWLGTGLGNMLTFPFRHPVIFLQHTLTLNNLGTIVGLLASFGFLALLRPRALWPLVFIGAQLILSSAQPGSYLRIHYTVPFIPFLAWAALRAYRDIRQGRLWPSHDRSMVVIIITLLGVIAPLYSTLIIGLAEWPWVGVRRDQPTAATVINRTLNLVRPTDRVLTTFNFLPWLANRPTLYSLNYVYLGRRQYSEIAYHLPTPIDVAVIDWQQLYEYQFLYRTTIFEGLSGPQRIDRLLQENHLQLVQRYGAVAVYRAGGSDDQAATPVASTSGVPEQPLGSIALLGQPTVTASVNPKTGWPEVEIRATWRALHTRRDEFVSIRYQFSRAGVLVWETPRVIGQGLSPASEWLPRTTWETHDSLVLPPTLTGAYTVHGIVVKPTGRYRLNRLRSFQVNIEREEIFGTIDYGTITVPPSGRE